MCQKDSSNGTAVIIHTELYDHLVHGNPFSNARLDGHCIIVRLIGPAMTFVSWASTQDRNIYPEITIKDEPAYIARYRLSKNYEAAYHSIKGTL